MYKADIIYPKFSNARSLETLLNENSYKFIFQVHINPRKRSRKKDVSTQIQHDEISIELDDAKRSQTHGDHGGPQSPANQDKAYPPELANLIEANKVVKEMIAQGHIEIK